MKKIQIAFLLVFAMLFLSRSVQSQELSNRFGGGLYGSAVKMVLGSSDRSTIDQWAGLSVSYGYTDYWIITLKGAYGWVYARNPDGSQFKAQGGYKTLLMPLNINFDFIPTPQRSFRPYFTAGGGLLQWEIRDMAGTTSFLSSGELVESEVNASLVFGIGLQSMLSDRLGMNVFFRYHQLFKGNEPTIGGTNDDNRAVIELGLEFKLWSVSNKDTDGDGYPDRWDLCPGEVEDFDGFKDEDGCPDLDNDNDNVLDEHDQCPDVTEDLDGFEDKDGCPDPDNDNDGISDEKDECPNKAEDFDGFKDEDGCPDLDNDQDGILDEEDECPNDPEVFNDFKDEDGCPDEEKPAMKKGAKVILRGVHFESGSAKLTSSSYTVLDTVYESLAANPEVEVEIRGYTDSVGEWNYNLNLSQKRAEMVKQYLVNRGIEPGRMRAVGYGEKDPIATNATAKGRAANRRIEFVRIK